MRHILVFILCLIYFCASAFSQINTDRVLSIGKNALYFEDYILSIQYFNQVIKAKPYLAEPYFFRAVAKINLDDYGGADADCSLALERNPFIVRAYHCRGVARLNLQRFDDAYSDFQHGLELDPFNQTLMLCSGVSLYQAQHYDSAQAVLSDAIQKYPKFEGAYLNRGQARLALSDTSGAMSDFNRVLSLDKYNANGYAARGFTFYLQKKYTEALADYNEALRLEPNVPGFLINRGLIRCQSNDLAGALEDYDRVIKIDPNNVTAYFNRALLRTEMGEYNHALSDFDMVKMIEPDNKMADFNIAMVNFKVGNYRSAIKCLNTLIDSEQEEPMLYQARAQVYNKLGDKKRAQVDFNTAMVLEEKLAKQYSASTEVDDEKTRRKSDKSIRKYKRFVSSDDFNDGKSSGLSYKNEFRGKVQNASFSIEHEPIFVLNYYSKENKVKRSLFYLDALNKLNSTGVFSADLLITNDDIVLTEEQVSSHFKKIEELSRQVSVSPTTVLYFARAIELAMVKDFQSAIINLDEAIRLDGGFALAYFCRANIRHKKIDFEITSSGKMSDSEIAEEYKLEYGLVMRDYDMTQKFLPSFFFPSFNKANVMLETKDYRGAIVSYSEAISVDADFAEAYYNRGLTYIYLNELEKGMSDLSKAGELGLYVAYNVMKRFGR